MVFQFHNDGVNTMRDVSRSINGLERAVEENTDAIRETNALVWEIKHDTLYPTKLGNPVGDGLNGRERGVALGDKVSGDYSRPYSNVEIAKRN